MAVIVAEYLGVRTDTGIHITPHVINKTSAAGTPTLDCPFKNSHCDKAIKGYKPICSIRDAESGNLWIVCPNRLCSSHKGNKKNPIHLNEHQKLFLHSVAKEIYNPQIHRDEVLVKREVPIPVTKDSDYSADYVMWRKNPQSVTEFNPDRPIVLEMQGGGESTNTGELTRHISKWEKGEVSVNKLFDGCGGYFLQNR